MREHPIPSDKGSTGTFEVLGQENKRLVQQILSDDASDIYETVLPEDADHDDELLLKKLRGLYDSCMNEDLLNARGASPLVRIVKKVKDLFNRKTTIVDVDSEQMGEEDKEGMNGLTAAVAYLHSRGTSL